MIPISWAFYILSDVKANKRQNPLFCQRERKTLIKICPCPSVTKVVTGTNINRRIIGLPISWKAASGKETGNGVWKYMRSV